MIYGDYRMETAVGEKNRAALYLRLSKEDKDKLTKGMRNG